MDDVLLNLELKLDILRRIVETGNQDFVEFCAAFSLRIIP